MQYIMTIYLEVLNDGDFPWFRQAALRDLNEKGGGNAFDLLANLCKPILK